MKFAYLFFISLLGFTTIAPQNKSQNQEKSIIEVSGTAEMEISPNEIHIDFNLEERFEKGEKISLDELEDRLKKELTQESITTDNLFINDVNAVISKGWFGSKTLSVASYDLKITDLSKIKKTFKIFEKLEITNARITKATHSDIEELKKKNRIDAMKATKEKADYLLEAIGEKTGKPIQINEQMHQNVFQANANYIFNNQREKLEFDSKIIKNNNSVVQFENIKIKTTMNAVFEIQ